MPVKIPNIEMLENSEKENIINPEIRTKAVYVIGFAILFTVCFTAHDLSAFNFLPSR